MIERVMIGAGSAAAAYRNDCAGRDASEPFSAYDGTWIAVASLLDHASRTTGENESTLGEALRLAEELLILHASERVNQEPGSTQNATESIRALAHVVEEHGALNTASLMLSAYVAAVPELPRLDLGRILFQQGRIFSKLGQAERAHATFRKVSRLGGQIQSAELKAWAFQGFGAMAQHRGDFADVHRWCVASARLIPKHGNAELTRFAHTGLFVSAAGLGRFNEALVHGWKSYELARGDSKATAEVLGNLGQLLLDAGHWGPAQAAYSAVLSAPQPPRIGMPSLGGIALASAALGDERTVRWAAREVEREAARLAQPFVVADAAYEIARALEMIGDAAAAEPYRDRAITLARAHGLHRILAQATGHSPSLVTDEAVSVLSPSAARVARAVERLRPRALPTHVSFVIAA